MMKNTKWLCLILSILMVLSLSLAIACRDVSDLTGPDSSVPDSSIPDSSTPDPEPTKYTVKFMNGENVVYETKAEAGAQVAIPTDPVNADSRYTFVGWEGIDEADMEAGYVEVFGEDITFNAQWYEMFGSETVFTATQLRNVFSITVDGVAEDAWLDTQAIALDQAGSYAKIMWDASNVYVFVNIVDADATGDSVEMKIDLLHSELYANDAWNGTDWGDKYRANFMVEGGYCINAGAESANYYWEWLSYGDQGNTNIISKLTETGYTAEFRIGTTNGSTPDEAKPAVDRVIGLSVRNLNNHSVAMESFAGYMDRGPKSLSNVKLIANENNDKELLSVKEVRENYSVVVDDKEDLLYKDASTISVGASTIKTLWKADGLYVLANVSTATSLLKIVSPLMGAEGIEITTPGTVKEIKIASPNGFAMNAYADLTVTYVDGEAAAVTKEFLAKLEANPQNFGRNIFEAKKLAEGASVTVDGVKDEAYGTEVSAVINTISLRENGGNPDNTGKAYIRWDDNYLYVFVEVIDGDVSTAQRGDTHNNDSVEVWLDTCQQLPQNTTGWGDANRPLGLYRGEGGFRVLANKIGGDSGSHWLWDDGRTRPTTASVLTETGYTVEYAIPWAHKFDEWDDGFGNYIPALGGPGEKTNQIINIMININEDDGQDGVREGIVSTNSKGCEAWHQPYVLDQLKLVE